MIAKLKLLLFRCRFGGIELEQFYSAFEASLNQLEQQYSDQTIQSGFSGLSTRQASRLYKKAALEALTHLSSNRYREAITALNMADEHLKNLQQSLELDIRRQKVAHKIAILERLICFRSARQFRLFAGLSDAQELSGDLSARGRQSSERGVLGLCAAVLARLLVRTSASSEMNALLTDKLAEAEENEIKRKLASLIADGHCQLTRSQLEDVSFQAPTMTNYKWSALIGHAEALDKALKTIPAKLQPSDSEAANGDKEKTSGNKEAS